MIERNATEVGNMDREREREAREEQAKQLRLASRDSSCRAMGLLVRCTERDLTGFVETPNLFLR